MYPCTDILEIQCSTFFFYAPFLFSLFLSSPLHGIKSWWFFFFTMATSPSSVSAKSPSSSSSTSHSSPSLHTFSTPITLKFNDENFLFGANRFLLWLKGLIFSISWLPLLRCPNISPMIMVMLILHIFCTNSKSISSLPDCLRLCPPPC